VEKVAHALNAVRKPVNGSNILVLGVAYKRDIDDVRESPALDVIRLLEEDGATVAFHDPFIPSIREDGHVRHGSALTPAILAATDAVVVVTDHKSVDYQMVVDNASLVVDSRNVLRDMGKSKARVVSLASSRSAAPSA
jgi:UDP-N-acetyl-D-glucosamine dehydrogenase